MTESFDPNNQVGRVLTIRMTIRNHAESRVIWDSFKKDAPLIAGCEIGAIASGDLFDERDKYQEVANAALDRYGIGEMPDFDEPEKIETTCGKTFYWHPFGVYSRSQKHYDSCEEWFSNLEALKEKYTIKEENAATAGT